MQDTSDLQEKLYAEFLNHIQESDSTAPLKHGPYFYYTKTKTGQNYPIYCRKKCTDRAELAAAKEHIWLDVNALAVQSKAKHFQMGQVEVSPNHDYAAYCYNTTGSVYYTIVIRSLTSGETLKWAIQDVLGGMLWANNNRHVLFVTRHPVNGRGYEVKCLDIQTGEINLIYTKPEKHALTYLGIRPGCNRRWIIITVGDHSSCEESLIDANHIERYFQGCQGGADAQQPVLVEPMQYGVLYSVEAFNETLIIHTNKNAENFQVMRAPLSTPGMSNWEPIIANQEDVYIRGLTILQTLPQTSPAKNAESCYLICQVTNIEKALPGIRIQSLHTGEPFFIEFPDAAYSLHVPEQREFISNEFIYFYQSPVQPEQSISFDLITQEQCILKARTVHHYDASQYTTERVYTQSHDGVQIPVTITRKKTTAIDGSAPCMVEGYGSYGCGAAAYFSAPNISLLDRGFVLAVAHVRGGDDKGHAWYLDGKLNKKKNTFFDFIAVCTYLVGSGYTYRGGIVAVSASAGGLLLGAVANMQPDLFRTIVADVPFVDLMNSMEDTSLPLTESEWDEWGNPLADKDAYAYMLSYSPYDNVTPQHYPNFLFRGGISDEQVAYWEPAKIVAKLRALKQDNNLLLLKMNMDAGHLGTSERYAQYRQLAFTLAFCLKTFELLD